MKQLRYFDHFQFIESQLVPWCGTKVGIGPVVWPGLKSFETVSSRALIGTIKAQFIKSFLVED